MHSHGSKQESQLLQKGLREDVVGGAGRIHDHSSTYICHMPILREYKITKTEKPLNSLM